MIAFGRRSRSMLCCASRRSNGWLRKFTIALPGGKWLKKNSTRVFWMPVAR